MSEACSHRVFFALGPDHDVTGYLSALAHDLAAGGGGRVIRAARFAIDDRSTAAQTSHITLARFPLDEAETD